MNTKSAAVYFQPNAPKPTQHHGDAIHQCVAYRLSHLAKLLKLTAGTDCGSEVCHGDAYLFGDGIANLNQFGSLSASLSRRCLRIELLHQLIFDFGSCLE